MRWKRKIQSRKMVNKIICFVELNVIVLLVLQGDGVQQLLTKFSPHWTIKEIWLDNAVP